MRASAYPAGASPSWHGRRFGTIFGLSPPASEVFSRRLLTVFECGALSLRDFKGAFFREWPSPAAYSASNRVVSSSKKVPLILLAEASTMMKLAQPFLELDKKGGALKLTLGDSFGRLLITVALLVGVAVLGKNLSGDQIVSLLKALLPMVKTVP